MREKVIFKPTVTLGIYLPSGRCAKSVPIHLLFAIKEAVGLFLPVIISILGVCGCIGKYKSVLSVIYAEFSLEVTLFGIGVVTGFPQRIYKHYGYRINIVFDKTAQCCYFNGVLINYKIAIAVIFTIKVNGYCCRMRATNKARMELVKQTVQTIDNPASLVFRHRIEFS